MAGENGKTETTFTCITCGCAINKYPHDGCSGCGGKAANDVTDKDGKLVVIDGGGPTPAKPQRLLFSEFWGNKAQYEKYCEDFDAGKAWALAEKSVRETRMSHAKPAKLTFQQFNGGTTAYDLYCKAYDNNEPWALREKALGSTDSDTFTCSTPDVDGCPIVKKKGYLVHMPYLMFQQWIWLAMSIDTEWMAYLKGEQDADGKCTITEMYFPKQKAEATHVEPDSDQEIQEGTIGTVHSHVGMAAFFSQEDVKHFNHPCEIVINRRAEWKTSVRLQLECGRYTRTESGILFKGDDEMEVLKTELQGKIVKPTTRSYQHYHGYGD